MAATFSVHGGETTDYGVHSGRLPAVMTRLSGPSHAIHGTRELPEAELQSGRSVMVELGMRGEGCSHVAWDDVGDRANKRRTGTS
jgi:hypothetical protein